MLTAVIATFIAVFFLLIALFTSRTEKTRDVEARLQTYVGGTGGKIEKIPSKKKSFFSKKEDKNILEMEKDDWRSKLKNELFQADIPLRPEEFLMFCFLGGFLIGLLLFTMTGEGGMFFLGFIVGIFIAPLLYIKRKKAKRAMNFNHQLSSALTTMANSLRVGFSLFQAMKTIADEMPPPLSVEFKRTLQEINLGTHTDKALQNMCDRVKSDDLELVVMAIVIQRQVGGNLAEVLDNIAHTIKERVKVQREVKTLTAQGRISGMIIGLLPLFLAAAIFMINPEYMMKLFTHPLGMVLIGMGLFSQFIGVMFIKKIVNISW